MQTSIKNSNPSLKGGGNITVPTKLHSFHSQHTNAPRNGIPT